MNAEAEYRCVVLLCNKGLLVSAGMVYVHIKLLLLQEIVSPRMFA
jgi:hypothetical protein